MQVVLACGKHVRVTRDNEFSDQFHTLPRSYGALGILVGATMDIIRVEPFMKVVI